jgi:hypothetical protein
MARMHEFRRGARALSWWISFALFGAIVLLFVIAALAIDPLTASVP